MIAAARTTSDERGPSSVDSHREGEVREQASRMAGILTTRDRKASHRSVPLSDTDDWTALLGGLHGVNVNVRLNGVEARVPGVWRDAGWDEGTESVPRGVRDEEPAARLYEWATKGIVTHPTTTTTTSNTKKSRRERETDDGKGDEGMLELTDWGSG